jgi:AcrR family transcriptional regulator
VKKRQAILESATRFFGSTGLDAATTLEIADKADVTEPLISYHFKGKDELFTHSLELAFNENFSHLDKPFTMLIMQHWGKLPKHTSTEFQKITGLIDLHFRIVDDLPVRILDPADSKGKHETVGTY